MTKFWLKFLKRIRDLYPRGGEGGTLIFSVYVGEAGGQNLGHLKYDKILVKVSQEDKGSVPQGGGRGVLSFFLYT